MDKIIDFLNLKNIIYYSFKPLAMLVAFFYVIFSLVILKQTEVMNRALSSKANSFFNIVSLLQLAFSLLILLLAIFLI